MSDGVCFQDKLNIELNNQIHRTYASTNPKGFNFNCDLQIEIESWKFGRKILNKEKNWKIGNNLVIWKK